MIRTTQNVFRHMELNRVALMMKKMHILVKGTVQGVYYRYNALKKAGEYHLTGWVRNRVDGSVEILCEGTEEDINNIVRWCKKGPERAYVSEIETTWEQHTGEFNVFEIR
jgi:acylphosphatase